MKKVKVSLKTSSSEDAVTSSSTVSPEEEARNPPEEARNPLDESRANAFATSGDATPDEGDSSPVDASAAESALLEGLASEVVVPEVVYSPELSTSRVLDEVTFVDEIVGNVDWDERDATAKKGGATPQTRRSKASPRKISPRDFVVSLGRLYRAGRHTCILCPIHSAALSRQDEEAVRNLSLDALAFVDKLSAPSNMDAFRSSDVFGRSEIVWQSEVLKSLDDDPVPSTSKSPPTSAPTSRWSPARRPANASTSQNRDVERATDRDAASEDNRSFISRILDRCCCGVGMKLRCFERNSGANSYYLLDNLGADKDSSTEKQEELQFFDDNGTFVTVVVEKNLRAIDLTLLLAVKNRVRKDFCWSIIEHWVELGTERVLEDHEDVLSIYRQTESAAKKYIFRRFQSKYDFFTAPESYFPPDMIDLKTYVSGCLASENYVEEISEEDFPLEFERVLMTAEELPVIFSQVNLRHKTEKRHWEKTFLLLKGSKVYMSSKVRVVAKFLRAWKNATGYKKLGSQSSTDQDEGIDKYVAVGEGNESEQLAVLADLEDYEVYTCLNSKNQLRGPTEFGVVLRKTSEEDFTDPVVLSFDKGKDRVCWVTAMRLAKYGKQLKENYRAFKNKHETLSGSSAINESARSRVAMDFTGKVGRIVEDPLEAKAIAVSEGNAWKKRLRAKAESSRSGGFPLEAGEEEKSHYGQPWYHRSMTREQAAALLSAHAKHDGVFVVRGSRSQPGGNVLSFKSQEKVVHFPITVVDDQVDKIMCYTIDSGTTKFFDICQLVEFYRLNTGPLPCRLSNHLERAPPLQASTAAQPEPN